MNCCPPWAQMCNDPPYLICKKVGSNGGRGVLPQKILNLVDVISCILVPFWDGQLEKGSTQIYSLLLFLLLEVVS